MRKHPNRLPVFLSLLIITGVLHADYHVIEVKHGGTLRGLVKYPDETAPRAMFGTRGDVNCPAGIPLEHLLVKQENRGIQNVLIVLSVREGKALPQITPRLDNKGCRFVPRMQWALKDSSLIVTNSDPTIHNVDALRGGVAAFSLTMDPKSPPARRPLVETGLYKLNCDRHLWMRAWIYVSDQPYVTITDNQGQFEIKDIPPGTYDLLAWHEGWNESGTDVTGQLRFIPMEKVQRVTITRDNVTDLLIDDLEPSFISDRPI